MLHHHDRIAFVAQLLERGDKLSVVSLMKSDARFVQDIEYVHKLGTDLCRQSDSLALSS